MLLTMVKIEIIGPKKYFYQALALLHQLGTLHIEDLSKKEDIILRKMDIDEEASETKKGLRNTLTRLNGVIGVIEPTDIDSSAKSGDDFSDKDSTQLSEVAEDLLAQLEEKTRSLASKKSQLELELTSLGRYQEVMKKVYPLAKSIIALKGSETVAFLLEGDYKDTVNLINKEIGKLTNDNHELISTPIDDTTTAAIIVFNKKYSAKIHRFLRDRVSELNLPSDMKDLTIDSVIQQIENKQSSYPKEIKQLQSKLNEISTKWYFKLRAVSSAIQNKVDEIEKITSFGQTEYTFVIQGWLPHKHMNDLKKEISKNFGSKVLVRQLELSPEDLEHAPVVMENSPLVKPFEIFLKILKPPKYGTIDPTLFIAIFFPIFFGFIVGDMGYGLIVFLTATALHYNFKDKKSDLINATTRIFQIAGISAFIFGAFYGEAFGTLLERVIEKYHLVETLQWQLGPLKIPYHRNPEIEGRLTELLVISITFGFIHLVSSLSLGIINSIKEKSRKHMWEKIGLLGFIISVVGLAISKALPLGFLSSPMIIILLASLVLVAYGGGPLALLEHAIGLLANLASYLRLMALGLAGAILAGVANSFVDVLGIGLGITLAITLHAINVVVHTFSPAIHSIRLNLLEGFGKFYEEGGKEYKPFQLRR